MSQHDHGKELQELRLRVLEGRGQEVPDIAIVSEHRGELIVLALLRREFTPSGPGLQDPADQEKRQKGRGSDYSLARACAVFSSCDRPPCAGLSGSRLLIDGGF